VAEPAFFSNLDRSQLASLSGQLAQQVLALIQNDALEPGDRLPSVKELSDRFSVATPTMREALRLLQMAGNLDIRHGSGIYVRRPESRLMLTNPYAGSLSTATILNLLHARLLIEPPVAELAAINATPKHIADLSELLAEAEGHLSGQDAADAVLGVVNMRFHRGIAEGSGNTILAEVVFTLTEVHIKEQMAVLDLYNNRRRDHDQHKLIFDALRRRDAAAARQLMTDHIADVIAVIQAKLASAPVTNGKKKGRSTLLKS
jgi:GntR family transcriptional regulator, transcriptional repressor for pyruvate dehydrogenase complex